jgi:hypothetical protein
MMGTGDTGMRVSKGRRDGEAEDVPHVVRDSHVNLQPDANSRFSSSERGWDALWPAWQAVGGG